jgi:hypothetical protein
MDMEEINSRCMALSEILLLEIDELIQNKDFKPVDTSFIAAGAIANVVGCFAGSIYDIDPMLVETFRNMIDKGLALFTK